MSEQLGEPGAHRLASDKRLSRLGSDGRSVNAVSRNELHECRQAATTSRMILMRPAAEYTSKAHPHGIRELIWVMVATLTLVTGGNETTASAGASIIFEADEEHTYRNAGRRACEFTMIVQLGVA